MFAHLAQPATRVRQRRCHVLKGFLPTAPVSQLAMPANLVAFVLLAGCLLHLDLAWLAGFVWVERLKVRPQVKPLVASALLDLRVALGLQCPMRAAQGHSPTSLDLQCATRVLQANIVRHLD